MRDELFALVDHAASSLSGGEVLLAYFVGEETDFVRWTRARVRQPLTVHQGHLTLSLVDGRRRDSTTLSLTRDPQTDRARVRECIAAMRDTLPGLPEDPYLLYSTEPSRSERVEKGVLPTAEQAVDVVADAARGTDLVGFHASGPVFRAFASSLGHRHWHAVESFQLDWSLYLDRDRAVQSSYSTSRWDEAELRARMERARVALGHLGRSPRTVEPGAYRAYLAPAAVWELVAMLNWGGASAKAQRTRTSCLERLVEGQAALSPAVTLRENTAQGLSPAFDDVGFTKPELVDLVVAGRHAGSLVGPRTASEYGLRANADAEETLRSADILPGSLPSEDALRALDRGIYVGNLWYLNFSDRLNARVTGMTRFATFWVEQGEIVAPLDVMRFDDTLYRLLGEHLLDLTREREWMLSSGTYGQRSVETARLPGLLVGAMTFTL